MILSGKEIDSQWRIGHIRITPYDNGRINPNSYNLHLSDKMRVYEHRKLDAGKFNNWIDLTIPRSGRWLKPGTLYLASTVEQAGSDYFIPMIEGRSSLGRLGIFVHATAGFGDVGFYGTWTLEISCIQPVKIYPFIEVCQLYFHTLGGEKTLYAGKYQGQTEPKASGLWKEFSE